MRRGQDRPLRRHPPQIQQCLGPAITVRAVLRRLGYEAAFQDAGNEPVPDTVLERNRQRVDCRGELEGNASEGG